MSETTQQVGMLSKIERRGEIAIAAMAAKAKAEVEARYVMAMQPGRQRIHMEVRNSILEACKRPAFCEGAIYRKPVGGQKTVDGFSIRFAEEAVKAMKNIAVDTMAIYEDEDRLTIRISVTDLEANTTYADEARIAKTVERRTLKEGQSAISERMNSTGQKVYLVAATDDDLLNKINAAKSKAIRNSGLRLIPQDILEEAWQQIWETMEKGGKDPKADTKKVCDGFSKIGVSPAELERYLGHALDTISPKELTILRGIYTAINDEETTWASVMETAKPKTPKHEGPDDDDVNMGTKKTNAEAAKTGAAVIDAAKTGEAKETKAPEQVIDKPLEHLLGLCKRDSVTEAQVHKFMVEKKLAGRSTEQLAQAMDSNMLKVIETWPTVIGEIRAIKV
jgi:hypothetical protein